MNNVVTSLSEFLTTESFFTYLPLLVLVLSSSIALSFVYTIIKTIIDMAPKGRGGI